MARGMGVFWADSRRRLLVLGSMVQSWGLLLLVVSCCVFIGGFFLWFDGGLDCTLCLSGCRQM